jgi:hypothetical protein
MTVPLLREGKRGLREALAAEASAKVGRLAAEAARALGCDGGPVRRLRRRGGGCKAIVAQRLKLSGMRWTVAGADAIIALRCREASSQWEEIWQRPSNQTATA